MTQFVEARLLDKVSYGFQGGPELRVRIKDLRSGAEQRDGRQIEPFFKYVADYRSLKVADYPLLLDAFIACGGPLVGFRFKDWAYFSVTDHFLVLAQGGEQTVQLRRAHQFGTLTRWFTIRKPVAGTISLTADAAPIASTTDTTTGQVTFTASAGQEIRATLEYDIPVRFDLEHLPFSYARFNQLRTSVPLMQDRSVGML